MTSAGEAIERVNRRCSEVTEGLFGGKIYCIALKVCFSLLVVDCQLEIVEFLVIYMLTGPWQAMKCRSA